MKEIALTQGLVTQVDDSDFDFLSQWKWRACRDKKTIYAGRSIRAGGRNRTVHMHRYLLQTSTGEQVDHRDGNGLNNQRSNLRIATHGQQQRNRSLAKNNKAGFKGVQWHTQAKKWRARIWAEGKNQSLGLYDTPEDAHAAYMEAAKSICGEFARAK